MKKQFLYIYQVLSTSAKNYIKNDCACRASSLTITTLLAIVPLLAVFMGLITYLPNFEQLLQPVQHFIFENFVPESGQAIEAYLLDFTSKANEFSWVGGVGLILSSLLLIYNIELALNKIWQVEHSRHFFRAIFAYMAILLGWPIFLGLGIAISAYIQGHVPASMADVLKVKFLLPHTAFMLAWLGFTGFYFVIPNCNVKLRHALLAALLATVFFEVIKQGFSLYLKYFASYEFIYGVFATIPIFIIWVYLLWLLTLFCAEFNHTLSVAT